MAKTISIAIDGPAGAGKSTIARRLAKELGYYYVDTGAIYRTVAYFMDLLGISPKDVDGVERYIDELTIEIEYDEEGVQHMIMNGMDVSGDIRTQDISQKASLVSAHAVVRDMLLDMQRNVAKKHNVIMDGRDIGTVVLPKANVKIFLTASAEVRAKRRTEELLAKGQKANYNQILKEIQQRDYQDTHREIAPLKMCRDSIKVDTSEMDIDQVMEELKAIVAEVASLRSQIRTMKEGFREEMAKLGGPRGKRFHGPEHGLRGDCAPRPFHGAPGWKQDCAPRCPRFEACSPAPRPHGPRPDACEKVR